MESLEYLDRLGRLERWSWTTAMVKASGLRDREYIARSVDAGEGGGSFAERVNTVPDAGELQVNVSLANADKKVADRSW